MLTDARIYNRFITLFPGPDLLLFNLFRVGSLPGT